MYTVKANFSPGEKVSKDIIKQLEGNGNNYCIPLLVAELARHFYETCASLLGKTVSSKNHSIHLAKQFAFVFRLD